MQLLGQLKNYGNYLMTVQFLHISIVALAEVLGKRSSSHSAPSIARRSPRGEYLRVQALGIPMILPSSVARRSGIVGAGGAKDSEGACWGEAGCRGLAMTRQRNALLESWGGHVAIC